MNDENPTNLRQAPPSGTSQIITWLDKTPIQSLPWLTMEVLIFAGIILLAIISRFYNLGERVMSHDESLHTYYSWLYYKGQGYQHNPMMHGPLQFHLIALTYFIFGASDFTARVPAAVFSILTVLTVWQWRRYLGRAGTLVAGAMALISPFLLFYGRYTREDPYVGVSVYIMLYSILRYLETGKAKYIYLISGSLALHFLTKETAFIYAALALIYLAAYFIFRVTQKPWEDNRGDYRSFIISLIVGIVSMLGVLVVAKLAGTPAPAADGTQASPLKALVSSSPLVIPLAVIGVLALGAAITFILRGYGWGKIREERSFDLLILIGTLVLPMLAAFPMKLLADMGVPVAIPTDQGMQSFPVPDLIWMGVILTVIAVIGIVIGYYWNKDVWWKAALLFYSIFTLFYSSFFTNGAGFFTGVIGSLGYWLGQQGVARGSQPPYYYILIQIPIYEFLPAIASLLALYFTIRQFKKLEADASPEVRQEHQNQINIASLLGWWSFGTIVAFTLAGEKMPWLTMHMALPMILWGAWAIGKIIDRIDWIDLRERKAWLVMALLAVFTISIIVVFVSLLGDTRPFAGKELVQLQATSTFIVSIIGAVLSGWGLYTLLQDWSLRQIAAINILVFFALLAVLTARASIRANYVLYDTAMEYLVYAHSFTGVKDVMRQVSDLSNKTTGDDHAIVVGYDDDTSWPLSWYMRDFKNAKFYGGSPGVDLREVPAIIVGDNNFTKIEPIVGDKYYRYDYIRMVWPNQDYFNLMSDRDATQPFAPDYPCSGVLSIFQLFKNQDFSRLCSAIGNPKMREAIFNIWLNRDYTQYAEVTGSQGVVPQNWDPADRMRLYIRKDVGQLVWKYGAAPVAVQPDPYEKATIKLSADLTIEPTSANPPQFNAPRAIAFASDGSFYVSDSRNHRIIHFAPDGQILKTWGSFAAVDISASSPSLEEGLKQAPGGTMNEPWGVAVGPDGAVYVSDTWNHRIQKFDANGNFIKAWGTYGQSDADNPSRLYGPRGIGVDSKGHVYVADTGNKRIVIFDSNGAFVGQFGSEGFDPGQFSEPVDVKLDGQGNVYVTDTWNQRVQVFSPSADGLTFTPLKQWPINGWKSQSLDNKPYITIAANGNVFVTDPEGYRVLEFTSDGQFVQTWGTFGTDTSSFGIVSGIATDALGQVWVVDAGNNRVLRFTVPAKTGQ
jgi:uncharacterized protein (TIGR03663 family)